MSLVSKPGTPAHGARRGGIPAAGGGRGRQGEEGEEEVLEVRPPPGIGGKVLRLRVLDGISLRVSGPSQGPTYICRVHLFPRFSG